MLSIFFGIQAYAWAISKMFGTASFEVSSSSAGRKRRCAEAHILLLQMSDHQEGIVVDNL
jgi:hypothetical protein